MKRKRSSSPETGSLCPGSSRIEYDVFLSFRGPDTRTTFTDSLYHTLLDKGISVFIDKQGIEVGEEIGPEIFQAINDSKICIPIFSKGYAYSSWCLRELEHMMERRKTNKLEVMPIFYDVEPSDMKLETEVYRDALTLQEEKHGAEIVRHWAEALEEVTRIKGLDTKSAGHGELARLIARKVLVKLKEPCVHIYDHLVGMDKLVNEVVDLLDVEYKDVRLIGIWGMGGIGKTTLAKVVYRKLLTNFESHSFIPDVREASKGHGLLNVQSQLIFDIIGVGDKPSNTDDGKNMIKNRFCKKKILIFLDDVDHGEQLMALAAKAEWFGLGSRIVVTTRNKHVLNGFQDQYGRCLIYEAKQLNDVEALQLFSKHTFRYNSPPNEFLSLSKKVTRKAGGLPLFIEVIGSFLYGKTKAVWQDTLKKMDYCPHKDVTEKLMLSYEALDHLQQQIFLDIACFLAGHNKHYPYYMWDACGFFPNEGIDVLLLMSLVKIGEENELWMHDQLKDLGRSIVYKEYCKDPRKGYRVWSNQGEALDIVQQKKGTETVQVSYYNSCLRSQDFVLTKDFIKMPNIRILDMHGVTLNGDFEDHFSELRWLNWLCSPKKMQATNFCPKNLVILNLSRSEIDEHWGGWTQFKVATRLKVLDLSHCNYLKEVPNLFAYLCLEILILEGCKSLLRIDRSIGMLKCLAELDVSNTGITELPNTIINLKSLKALNVNRCCIQKLPEAIGMLEKLEEIYGLDCNWLKTIPDDIVRLPFLKILILTETRVKNVPKLPQSLVCLWLSSGVSEKPPHIPDLFSLKDLKPFCIGSSWGLRKSREFAKIAIDMAWCELELPSNPGISSDLSCLHHIKTLGFINCKSLRQIGQLSSSLTELRVYNCNLLEVVEFSTLSNFKNLKDLQIWDCPKLDEIQSLDKLESLESLEIGRCSSRLCLPDLCNWKKLKQWNVDALTTCSARGKRVARIDYLPRHQLIRTFKPARNLSSKI